MLVVRLMILLDCVDRAQVIHGHGPCMRIPPPHVEVLYHSALTPNSHAGSNAIDDSASTEGEFVEDDELGAGGGEPAAGAVCLVCRCFFALRFSFVVLLSSLFLSLPLSLSLPLPLCLFPSRCGSLPCAAWLQQPAAGTTLTHRGNRFSGLQTVANAPAIQRTKSSPGCSLPLPGPYSDP